MPISEYAKLDIVGKASSKTVFKNINQKLLDGLNEEQKQIYLTAFGNPNSSPIRTFGIFACVFTILITSLILQSPSFWLQVWVKFYISNVGKWWHFNYQIATKSLFFNQNPF